MRGRGLALLATSLGFGVVQLDVSVVNVAVQPIRADLGGGVADLQWVVNAYTVAFAALLLSAGALGDRVGAKRVFVGGFVLFTLASAACGLAPGLPALIAARAVQGVGAAVLVPCSLTLLNHAYREPAARARAVGIWLAGASVALSAGPLVSGVLIAAWSWRAIFFINLPLGLLAIVLTLRFADETSRSPDRGLDVPGQVSGIVALAALSAALVTGGRRGFADPLVLAGFAVAALAGATFVLVERHRARPMLPPSLFASRTFSTATVLGLLVNTVFYGLVFVLSLWFQQTLGYSALRTGLAFLPATVGVLAANLLASRVSAALGVRRTFLGAVSLMLLALGGLLLVSGADTAYVAVVAPLAALGLGLGLAVPVITALLLGSVDTDRSGVASGTLNTARQTGSVVGVALFGSLAATSVVAGLRASLGVSLGLAVVSALAATGLATVRG
jgi:MFS transporter, DHA2 family, methylenomycin A resistance protein